MSSAYWLVAGQRNRLAVLAGPRTVAQRAGDVDIPGSSSRALALGVELLGAFIFLVASLPLIIVPYWLVPSPMFVPKRKSQWGVVGSRAVRLRVYCLKLCLL